jgi:cytochrome c553
MRVADLCSFRSRRGPGSTRFRADDGKGDDENSAIAGMSVADFTKAITEYQDGTRTKDAKMAKAAKKLTPADVADLAAYYAKLPK